VAIGALSGLVPGVRDAPGYSGLESLFGPNIQEPQSPQFLGAVPISYNGYPSGEIDILERYHMCNALPYLDGGACFPTSGSSWEDVLALHGYYTGHWKRDSDDPGCGARLSCSPYERVNG
jgi:hypothetical protein